MVNRTYASLLAVLVLCFGGLTAKAAEGNISDLVNRAVLRACADPANLPYSNEKGEGFEIAIAKIVADELNIPVEFTYIPQVQGFVRSTLSFKRCDVIIGFAQGHELVLNTNHYYTSTYALIYKKGSDLEGVDHIGDPRLKGKRIGVIAGTPPSTPIARAGLMAKAKPYRLQVYRRYESPGAEMVTDIRSGEIDAGVLWGPMAGYFANIRKDGDAELVVQPLLKEGRNPRMEYRITMGVRPNEREWKHELNEIIKKRQGDIDKILLDYNVPLLDDDNQLITKPRTP